MLTPDQLYRKCDPDTTGAVSLAAEIRALPPELRTGREAAKENCETALATVGPRDDGKIGRLSCST